MEKTFTVDTASEESCQKLIGILKSYLGEIRVKDRGLTSAERKKQVFEACNAIWNTPIDSVYSQEKLDASPKFYVYAHLDSTRKIAIGKDGKTTFAASIGMEFFPFYIGKGIGSRAFDINRNETHRKVRERMASFGYEPIVKILKDDLTEVEALSLESKLIDIFGLVTNRGRLTNLDEGLKKLERRALYREHLNVLSQLHRNSV